MIPNTNVIKCYNCHKILGFISSKEFDDDIQKLNKQIEVIKKDLQQIKNVLDVVYNEVQNNNRRI